MPTNFPGGLDAFVNPGSLDKQNSPSHSAQHDNVNDAVAALEAKVGIDGSAVTTSLDYLVAHSQPLDATLTALAAANWAANAIPIGTGADALAQTSFAANTFPARASSGNLAAKAITDFGLSLVDDTDAATARTTLGLGTLATQSGTFSGTSSGTNTGDVANTALTTGTLAQFAATASAQLAGVISDETGSGALVFATSPVLVTPVLGTPSSGNLANCTGYPGIPAAANPSASIGLTAVNGSASTFLRSDGAPALSVTITPTWTGLHTHAPVLAANTVGDGIVLSDTVVASSGNQQYSPAVRWTGQGWKTNATAGSQAVDFRAYAVPVQGAANPAARLVFQSSINGGAFGSDTYLNSSGQWVFSGGSGGNAGTTIGNEPGNGGVFIDSGTGGFTNICGFSDILLSASGTPNIGGKTIRWRVKAATGHITAEADNTYDIGASGASRPRTVYAGTSIGVNTSTPGAGLEVDATGAAVIGGLFKAAASRTVALLQLQTSAGASLGTVGGTVFNDFTDISTTSTDGTEDTLSTYTLAANTLIINGDSTHEIEHVQFVSSATAARRLKKYFAGQLIFDSGALTLTLGGDFVLETAIIRESSTVVRVSVNVVTTSASSVPYATYTRITSLTLSATNILKTTAIASGTGAASGDIVSKLSKVFNRPAA